MLNGYIKGKMECKIWTCTVLNSEEYKLTKIVRERKSIGLV